MRQTVRQRHAAMFGPQLDQNAALAALQQAGGDPNAAAAAIADTEKNE